MSLYIHGKNSFAVSKNLAGYIVNLKIILFEPSK